MKITGFKSRYFFGVLLPLLFLLANCRGEVSDKPPFHLNPNMDFQSKEKAQDMARPIPEGTVAFGYEQNVVQGNPDEKFIKQESSYATGKNVGGQYLERIPMEVDRSLLLRGQSRFNIYCAACHDRAGTSRSIVVRRGVGIPPPPDLASENLVAMPDGQIFQSIKYGIRNMPGYASQLDSSDLWAVVAYVRAIQVSRTAEPGQIPAKVRESLTEGQ